MNKHFHYIFLSVHKKLYKTRTKKKKKKILASKLT